MIARPAMVPMAGQMEEIRFKEQRIYYIHIDPDLQRSSSAATMHRNSGRFVPVRPLSGDARSVNLQGFKIDTRFLGPKGAKLVGVWELLIA